MITIEQAKKVLEDRGYKPVECPTQSPIYTGESVTIELHDRADVEGIVATSVILLGRKILCKTQQELLWAAQIFELVASAYHGDWAMCEDLLGCR